MRKNWQESFVQSDSNEIAQLLLTTSSSSHPTLESIVDHPVENEK